MSKLLAKDKVLNLLMEQAEYDDKLQTHYSFMRQVDIAEALDIVPMTVNRSIKQLKKEGKIDYVSKNGRHKSGHIVTFNMDNIKTNKDNPLTGTTVTAEEVYKEYFEPVVNVPKRRYRTKEQIAEDELKKTEEQKKIDEINDRLEGYSFVPKSFFRRTSDPEGAYRGYMLSRIFNSLLVAFAEDWKTFSDFHENESYYQRAQYYYNKYRNYDVLGKRFAGTKTYNHYVKLANFLHEEGIDPEEYLSVHINRMYYRLKNGGKAHPPHIFNMASQGGALVYQQQVIFKKEFEEKFPMYATPGNVDRKNEYYPIIEALKTEFNRGLEEDSNYFEDKFSYEAIEEEIRGIKEQGTFNQPKVDAVLLTYDKIVNDKNYDTLTEEEQVNLKKYLQRNIGVYKDPVVVVSEYLKYLLPTIRYHADKLYGAPESDNRRGYFAEIGNFTQEKDLGTQEGQQAIEDGFKLYISLKGNSNSLAAVRTMVDETDAYLEYRHVKSALDKLETNVPLTASGMIDSNELVEQLAKDNPTVAENIKVNNQKKKEESEEYYREFEINNCSTYWYNQFERYGEVGTNPRDGRFQKWIDIP